MGDIRFVVVDDEKMNGSLAIAVIAYNRPRYLHVALTSIFALRGVEKCPVYVYFDGGIDDAIRERQLAVVSKFPVKKYVFGTSNRGCLWNVTDAVLNTFATGVDEVLYVESDMILRPDTLDGLAEIPRDADFYNLVWDSGQKAQAYTPGANLVGRERFAALYKWLAAGKHVGLIRPVYETPITKDLTSHDGVYYAYVIQEGLQTRYADVSYAAHFGIHGMNHGLNEAEKALEDFMFSGRHDMWLPRIAAIVDGTLPVAEEVKAELFFPKTFRYDDGNREAVSVTQEDVDKYSWQFVMDLGNGLYTKGGTDPNVRLAKYRIPDDLTGWTVLDIGAFEGQYSFECERRGAERVVALDTDDWAWKNRKSQDGKLLGKQNFDFARAALGSKVEDITMDVHEITPDLVGCFDLVLLLGVLYHLRHPLLALERISAVTDRLLIVETHTNGNDLDSPAMIFYPDMWNGDPSNWWGPNKACLIAMLKDVGFSDVELVYDDQYPKCPIPTYHARKLAETWQ